MKVIDLLNKIANGEKSIPINYDGNSEESLTYYLYDKCGRECDDSNLQNILNDEVEIIEDKKIPEKIDEDFFEAISGSCRDRIMKDKIDEIIDYLEEKE